MNLVALPAFTDNYIWMLHDGQQAIVVDPGEAVPVERALHAEGLALAGILVTHHHADHTGGIDRLRVWPGCQVIGPALERLSVSCDRLVRDGDKVSILDCIFRVIALPGHTAGHVGYYWAGSEDGRVAGIVFCGDTLFSAGCGRVFEGTMQQMKHSLDRLAALPDDTRVCCAHEYTLANLRFAQAVEPFNSDISAHAQRCALLREQGRPTLPTSLAIERCINPFLRCDLPEVAEAAAAHGAPDLHPVAVFTALRGWKDQYR